MMIYTRTALKYANIHFQVVDSDSMKLLWDDSIESDSQHMAYRVCVPDR